LETFDWTINEIEMWPPKRRPRPPFGPTAIEVLRSCPLRGCFENSEGYERRMSYSGRLGTAFHRVYQSLIDDPPNARSTQEVAEEVRRRFMAELARQEAERAERPRERELPKAQERIHRAMEAILSESLRLFRAGVFRTLLESRKATGSPPLLGLEVAPSATAGEVEVEVRVQSADGLLRGYVDRAEHSPDGVRLVDYKSAMRDDLPERYVRQLQIYASLWHETRGEWPCEAELVYPLMGSTYQVPVDRATCEQVGRESREVIIRLQKESDLYRLATPGEVCKACEFRPWCKPFWYWQSSEASHSIALDRAALGLEGTIDRLDLSGHYWRLDIHWRDCVVKVVVPEERFPQLRRATIRMRVRVLDARLQGLRHQPRAVITEASELFLMMTLRSDLDEEQPASM
jgi:CRISPR/Cas system-associated exonuclease Cas4 (RecB family)